MTAPALSSPSLSIGFIGCGHMGSAMLLAWLKKNLVRSACILKPSPLDDRFSGYKNVTSFQTPETFKTHLAALDCLILATRPAELDSALAPFAQTLDGKTIVLSIAAGKTLSSIESQLPAHYPVVRAMPNLPVLVEKGVTGACTNANLSSSQRVTVQSLLEAIGTVAWVEEKDMDIITALSGSGPGYVFHLVDVLAKAAQKAGLDEITSVSLARETIIGTAHYLESQKDKDARDLRTSMLIGGTTQAALNVLMDGRLQSLFDDAIDAAVKRAKELSR